MTTIYLDNSVLDKIWKKQAGTAVRALLDAHQGVVLGSIQNLLEGWRIDNESERGEFIQTLLEVATSYEEDPILLEAARGLMEEIRAHHPDWLIAAPDLSSHQEHRDSRIYVWQQVRQDPTFRPANFVARLQFLYEAIGASMDRQRAVRKLRQLGLVVPVMVESIEVAIALQPVVDALSAAEADWRDGMAAAWWRGAIAGDANLTDLRDYLRPYLAVDQIAVAPWMRFWLTEVSGPAVPIIRAEGLAQHFQPDHPIGQGNWGDINHSGSAVGRDYVLTADASFFQVLTDISNEANMAIAAPRFVPPNTADVVAEIGTALSW